MVAMRALVDMEYGSEKMESDLKAIDAWLVKQDYFEEGAQKIAGIQLILHRLHRRGQFPRGYWQTSFLKQLFFRVQ